MEYLQNNWNAIRQFYAELQAEILACPANEWADDAYCWDERRMIFFTPIETCLWADIRQCGAVLWPQYPVMNFFVDFANPVAKVAVECDGAAFHMDKAKDAARDKRLVDAGWSVYRISGRHCRIDSDEETGAPGFPELFIQAICDRHGISRFDRRKSDFPLNDGWVSNADLVDQWWENAKAIRAEALARKRGDL